MMPAQVMAAGVPVRANAGPEFLHFLDEFVSRHQSEIIIDVGHGSPANGCFG
jgi:thiazole synthase ThiGH ThiG subunit